MVDPNTKSMVLGNDHCQAHSLAAGSMGVPPARPFSYFHLIDETYLHEDTRQTVQRNSKTNTTTRLPIKGP